MGGPSVHKVNATCVVFNQPVAFSDPLSLGRDSLVQSISHVKKCATVFREYNNFYEGEFVLYKHTNLPFSVSFT